MKKRTKKVIADDITKRFKMNLRLIEDNQSIKREAIKLQLQGENKELMTSVVKQYDNQMKEIEENDFIDTGKCQISLKNINPTYNYENYLMNNFKMDELIKIDDRVVEDMTILSEYQSALLDAMDKIHNDRTKKQNYDNYKLYDADGDVFVDSGNFKNMDDALYKLEERYIKNTTNGYKLRTGHKYYILSSDKKATFKFSLSSKIENVHIISLKNNIQITCETLDNIMGWVHTTYQTTDYKINDLILSLQTNKNVRNIQEPESIPVKEYQYTYKHRGFSPGCQPVKGLLRYENVIGFDFEVIIYNRQLTDKELNEYELKALN